MPKKISQLSFSDAKINYDEKYKNAKKLDIFLPEHLTLTKKTDLLKKDGSKNEQFYKWQFLFSLINSGLFAKDFIGTEIHFPKGNKSSAPLKLDAAVFDDSELIFSKIEIPGNLFAAIVKDGLSWHIKIFDSEKTLADYDFSSLKSADSERNLILHNLHFK